MLEFFWTVLDCTHIICALLANYGLVILCWVRHVLNTNQCLFCFFSVLWHCWLGVRKGIRPVKTEWWGAGRLSVWSELHTCICPSWCHCHSLSLASVKSRLVLPFWYRLTRVVPEKRPLNVWVCVCSVFFWGGEIKWLDKVVRVWYLSHILVFYM